MDEAVWYAAVRRDFDRLLVQMRAGCDVNYARRCADGTTALMAAANHGRRDIVMELLKRGASTLVRDFGKRTAADIAAQQGYAALATFLSAMQRSEEYAASGSGGDGSGGSGGGVGGHDRQVDGGAAARAGAEGDDAGPGGDVYDLFAEVPEDDDGGDGGDGSADGPKDAAGDIGVAGTVPGRVAGAAGVAAAAGASIAETAGDDAAGSGPVLSYGAAGASEPASVGPVLPQRIRWGRVVVGQEWFDTDAATGGDGWARFASEDGRDAVDAIGGNADADVDDYDSNAEDNSANEYPDEDEFPTDDEDDDLKGGGGYHRHAGRTGERGSGRAAVGPYDDAADVQSDSGSGSADDDGGDSDSDSDDAFGRTRMEMDRTVYRGGELAGAAAGPGFRGTGYEDARAGLGLGDADDADGSDDGEGGARGGGSGSGDSSDDSDDGDSDDDMASDLGAHVAVGAGW